MRREKFCVLFSNERDNKEVVSLVTLDSVRQVYEYKVSDLKFIAGAGSTLC